MIETKKLADAFALFEETWSPRIAGQINDMYLKLAKLEGEFIWHRHECEDELFLVVKGRLRIELRDQAPLLLGPGEFTIIPRGVEHKPIAEERCEVVLLEPATTLNTGDVENERTVRDLARLP